MDRYKSTTCRLHAGTGADAGSFQRGWVRSRIADVAFSHFSIPMLYQCVRFTTGGSCEKGYPPEENT